MTKVTSKRQVTMPKTIADRYGIEPGDEIGWEAAGDVIRVLPPRRLLKSPLDVNARLDLFDQATERQHQRNKRYPRSDIQDRGWKREDLYDRDLPH